MSYVIKRVLACALLSILSVLTVNAEKYAVPFKTISGVYGYHSDNEDRDIWPMFSYAGNFSDGFAPVSFDNYNFGLLTKYGFLATELCFKGIPRYLKNGLVLVDDRAGKSYITDVSGKPLTPHMRDLRFSNGFLTAIDSLTGKTLMLQPDLSPIAGRRHSRYSLNYDKVLLQDSLYVFRTMRGIDEVNGGKSFVTESLIDASGSDMMPSGLSKLSSLQESSFNKSIKDKLFTDNGVSPTLRSLFYTAEANGKFGIYFIDGSEILAPKFKDSEKAAKQFAKDFKKIILPRLKNGELQNVALKVIEDLGRKEKESENAFLAAWGVGPNSKIEEFDMMYGPVEVKSETIKSKTKAKKGKKNTKATQKKVYRFNASMSSSPKIGDLVFDDLIDNNVYFFGKKQGEKKYHLYNSLGIQVTVDPYDEIQSWGYSKDNDPRFRVRNGKDWGIINIVGREMLTPQFSEIEMGGSSFKNVVAVRDGKYYLVDFERGRLLNGVAYDEMNPYIKGRYKVKRLGYTTEVDENGKEDPSIATSAYNEACDKEMSAQDKVIAFAKCIELCGPDDRNVLGMAYNNMGYYYNEAGDIENAKKFYKKATEYGNDLAANNLRILTSGSSSNSGNSGGGNFLSTLGQIANALGQLGGNSAFGGFFNGMTGTSAITDGGSGMTGGGAESYSGSESGSGSSGHSSSLDPSFYINTYKRWEGQAKSNYESLTLRGTRTTVDGKAESGTTQGFWRHHTSGVKRLLRNAQSEMRKIRQEARRAGVNIAQSEYETVTVSY